MELIANPIYDSAFKYLLEDDRIAKILISALLNLDTADILELQQMKNDVVDVNRRDLKIFHVDFSARIVDRETGREEQVCIELQKSWHKEEYQRFRTYLSTQIGNESNVDKDGYPLHIISVYIFGHVVVSEYGKYPILYINPRVEDPLGNVLKGDLKNGKRNRFLDAMAYNMVIVQIPFVNARPNSRLDKILSIFDAAPNSKVIEYTIPPLPDTDADKKEIDYIVRRLTEAAANSEVRRKMSYERYIDNIIDGKTDAEEKYAKSRTLIKEQQEKLEEQQEKLEAKDKQLEEKDKQLETVIAKSVLALSGAKSASEIAEMLGIDASIVEQIINAQ